MALFRRLRRICSTRRRSLSIASIAGGGTTRSDSPFFSESGFTEALTFSMTSLQIEGRDVKLELARLDLRDVEHVVDELEQVPRAAPDHPELLDLLRVQRACQTLQHDPGEADDRVQRRAQLVGHRGEEGGLQSIGRLRGVLGQRQLGGALGHAVLQVRRISLEVGVQLAEFSRMLDCAP